MWHDDRQASFDWRCIIKGRQAIEDREHVAISNVQISSLNILGCLALSCFRPSKFFHVTNGCEKIKVVTPSKIDREMYSSREGDLRKINTKQGGKVAASEFRLYAVFFASRFTGSGPL